MATASQVRQYNLHKQADTQTGIGQSTFKHKTLTGSLDTASSTGNQIYTGAGPQTALQTTTDTLVWATWMAVPQRHSGFDDTEIGRKGIPYMKGQMPTIDDNANVITVAHDDWIQTPAPESKLYRVENPTLSPDGGFWSFEMISET